MKRRSVTYTLMVLGAVLLLAGYVVAQPPPPPAAPTTATVSRSWFFEAVIFVAMAGLALFVVCRSARRN